MPGLRKILTDGESKVDRVLDEYARDNGYRLLLKPRFRDVIDVDDMHLSGRERNFTFAAHLDFVAADAATTGGAQRPAGQCAAIASPRNVGVVTLSG
ncbi:hypothetical protein E0H75_41535 [Kribbella capetownensis]|uniref:Uncharacterized protein n=1 Tax=Kribbella capetownensis TaxID=1572659 RepID=A0A4R0IRJ2_9ACTN|nr:hypothetical protein [Kribbella capetownensis]TCC35270.1 hypothetical protein E0H75_41535 [Kribbella capetownensis]